MGQLSQLRVVELLNNSASIRMGSQPFNRSYYLLNKSIADFWDLLLLIIFLNSL